MRRHYLAQTFAYLFEEEYPAPGDYDYNDIVLRISMELSGKREVRFNVRLAAVGGEKQMGAAIRLAGYKYDEIESVKTVDNASFNIGAAGEIPELSSSIIKENERGIMFLMKRVMNTAHSPLVKSLISLPSKTNWMFLLYRWTL